MPVPGYRLTTPLGAGGAGQVWKSTRAGVEVAIKVVNLDRNIGQIELRALSLVKSIQHSNLVPIHGFWLKDAAGMILEGGALDASTPLLRSLNGSSVATKTGPSAEETGESRAILDGPVLSGTLDVHGVCASDTLESVGPTTTSPDDARKFDHTATFIPNKMGYSATQLIVAMGIGDATLSDRLAECHAEKRAGIPRNELLDYLYKAAEAIDLLNERGIQHCDIKPSNILLVGRGQRVQGGVQVCDFGLAQAVGGDASKQSVAYSPAYAAPELMRGTGPTTATDQFSLAISYVELVTGELPYRCATLSELREAKTRGELDLSRLPRHDRRVIRKACDLDATKRFRDSREMIAAMQSHRGIFPLMARLFAVALIVLIAILLLTRPDPDGHTADGIEGHLNNHEYRVAWQLSRDLKDDAREPTYSPASCVTGKRLC